MSDTKERFKPVPIAELPRVLSPQYLIYRAWDGDYTLVGGQTVIRVDRTSAFSGPEVETAIFQEAVARGVLPIHHEGTLGFPQMCLLNDTAYRTVCMSMAVAISEAGNPTVGKLVATATSFDYPADFLRQKGICLEIELVPSYDSNDIKSFERAIVLDWIRRTIGDQIYGQIIDEVDRRLLSSGDLDHVLEAHQGAILADHRVVELVSRHRIVSQEFKTGAAVDPQIIRATMSTRKLDPVIKKLLPYETKGIGVTDLLEEFPSLSDDLNLPQHQLEYLLSLVIKGVCKKHLELFPYFNTETEFKGGGLRRNITWIKRWIIKEAENLEESGRLCATVIYPR